MRVVAALAVLLLLGGARPAPAAEADGTQHFILDYDVRWGLFSVMTLRTTASIEPTESSYRSEVLLFTRGLVSWLFPWRARSETFGTIVGDQLRPRRHRSVDSYRGERHVVEIDYGEDGAVDAIAQPPLEGQAPIAEKLRDSTLDALTATMVAMRGPAHGEPCGGILPVFDGRRRYDLYLHDLGDEQLEPAGSRIYDGTAHHCRAIVRSLGGLWRNDMPYGERLASIDYWIATVNPRLPAVPVEMELSGKRGSLSVYLTAAR